jgi:hypothetical protein
MISHKITTVQKLLEVLADPSTVSPPPLALIRLAAKQLKDCAANVRDMEEQVIPRRQRLTDEHLASGKIRVLGIIPRNEAFL